jgi:hypothetical protein
VAEQEARTTANLVVMSKMEFAMWEASFVVHVYFRSGPVGSETIVHRGGSQLDGKRLIVPTIIHIF